MGPIYAEWRATCDMTLGMVCKLLQGANPLPELVEFISKNDIHSSVQKRLPIVRVWWVDVHILAFLSVSHLLESEFFLLIDFNSYIASKCLRQLEDIICDTASSFCNWFVK